MMALRKNLLSSLLRHVLLKPTILLRRGEGLPLTEGMMMSSVRLQSRRNCWKATAQPGEQAVGAWPLRHLALPPQQIWSTSLAAERASQRTFR